MKGGAGGAFAGGDDPTLHNAAMKLYTQLCGTKRQLRPDPALLAALQHNTVKAVVDNYSSLELCNLGTLIARSADVCHISLAVKAKADDPDGVQKCSDDSSRRTRRIGQQPEIFNHKMNHFIFRAIRSGLEDHKRVLSDIDLTGVPFEPAALKELGRGLEASQSLTRLSLKE